MEVYPRTLSATNFGFGANSLADAIIVGVQVSVICQASNTNAIVDNIVQLIGVPGRNAAIMR